MMKQPLLRAALLIVLLPAIAHAQTPRHSVQLQAIEFEAGSTEKMAAYGLLIGTAGLLALLAVSRVVRRSRLDSPV